MIHSQMGNILTNQFLFSSFVTLQLQLLRLQLFNCLLCLLKQLIYVTRTAAALLLKLTNNQFVVSELLITRH